MFPKAGCFVGDARADVVAMNCRTIQGKIESRLSMSAGDEPTLFTSSYSQEKCPSLSAMLSF